jgi:hypothetical protein
LGPRADRSARAFLLGVQQRSSSDGCQTQDVLSGTRVVLGEFTSGSAHKTSKVWAKRDRWRVGRKRRGMAPRTTNEDVCASKRKRVLHEFPRRPVNWDAKNMTDSPCVRLLLFHRSRVFAAPCLPVAVRAMDQGFLCSRHVGLFAMPDVHGRLLNRARI